MQLRIADYAISDKSAHCRGDQYIDGSLTDFINSSNSRLLHCDGEALILDYFQVGLLQRDAVCHVAYNL